VEEYLASIKKSYETFKFLPREARIKEILVGNSEVFPKLDMQPMGDRAMFIRPDFQPTVVANKSNVPMQGPRPGPGQAASTMPSFIGNLSSYAKPSSEPAQNTTPDINVSQGLPSSSIPDSGTNYPSNVPNTGVGQVTDRFGNTCSVANYNQQTNTCNEMSFNNIGNLDEVTDGSGNRCKRSDYDAKTHKCRELEEMATDASGNKCKVKNIDPKTGRCNTVHDNNGVLCHKKNIGPDGKCAKPIVEEPAKPCKDKDPKTGKCLDTAPVVPVPNKPTTDKDGNTVIQDKKTGNTITKKPDGTVEVRDAKGNIVKTNKEKKSLATTDSHKESAMMSLENSVNKDKVATEPKPITPTSTAPVKPTVSKPPVKPTVSKPVAPIKKPVPVPISNAARNNPKPSYPITLRRRKGGRKTRKMYK